MASRRKKFIIDTDAGIDDAYAIAMALNDGNVDVLAITTVTGNARIDLINKNVLRTLKVLDRFDVPVYQGASTSLSNEKVTSALYHGNDGLGDVAHEDDFSMDIVIKSESAAGVLTRLAKENEGEIELIAIGPLTNVALAIKLDPSFGSNLRHCHIMGGNYEGKGNITEFAEFNFYFDPEAANMTLTKLGCPITISCWELSLYNPLSWDYYDRFVALPGKAVQFLRHIESVQVPKIKTGELVEDRTYRCCDQFAMAIALDRALATEVKRCHTSVKLDGAERGMMVPDWSNSVDATEINVAVVTKIDTEKFCSMLESLSSN